MKEVVSVAQALGHKVPDSEIDVLMARCACFTCLSGDPAVTDDAHARARSAHHPGQSHAQGLNSSMQADVANGYQTEVEGEPFV